METMNKVQNSRKKVQQKHGGCCSGVLCIGADTVASSGSSTCGKNYLRAEHTSKFASVLPFSPSKRLPYADANANIMLFPVASQPIPKVLGTPSNFAD